MQDEILKFIKRFPDSNWLNGNCYYFAAILNMRFGGKIVYDTIGCHFLNEINGVAYDYLGGHQIKDTMIEWNKFDKWDHLQHERIVEDCIL